MNSNSIDEGAIALHELYMSFVKAGFTPEQALELIKSILQKQYPQKPEEPY